jgi:hypothetical protein
MDTTKLWLMIFSPIYQLAHKTKPFIQLAQAVFIQQQE